MMFEHVSKKKKIMTHQKKKKKKMMFEHKHSAFGNFGVGETVLEA